MKLLFFGAGAFGLPTLERLDEAHDIVAVVSQPDKPAGRRRVMTPTPIAKWALDRDLPVLRAADVNTPGFIEEVQKLEAEASVVIAFGQKLCPELIASMGRLAVNLHSSLLPRYRGAAPINWAMINGDEITGLSVIGLSQKMDGGDIYAKAQTPISTTETAGELHDRLAQLGPDLVLQVLDDLLESTLSPLPQDNTQATRAPKLKKSHGTVDFNQDAASVRAWIHGLTPWPGCKVYWLNANGDLAVPEPLTLKRVIQHTDDPHSQPPGTVLANLRVACLTGSIELVELQLPGKRAMPIAQFLQGHKLEAGDQFQTISRS